jgi:acetaldehyde dehydrogenase
MISTRTFLPVDYDGMKLKVGIIGTGNIGTDLLIKIMRSPDLTCTLFSGRTLGSAGMARAMDLGIRVSDQGILPIIQDPSVCDLVVDCTSAQSHVEHWRILEDLGKTTIDMTPAKLGELCIPAISTKVWDASNTCNINMVTCGGQTTVPIAHALSQVHDIEYIEVASSIASLSAGPATRRNLDEYVDTTEAALRAFSGAKGSKAILILNPAIPPIDMVTTIYARINDPDLSKINASIDRMIRSVREYVPGYQLIVPPRIKDGTVVVSVKVTGAGDYLPPYAGNLDIINCAAIRVMEMISRSRLP